MELWIRSQDKMILSKISNLQIAKDVPVSLNSTVVYPDCIINEIGEIFGAYRNTKRALEVLDEIQDILIDYKEMSRVVYQMPKE